MSLHEIAVSEIQPSPFNVRVDYPEEELRTLGESIKQNGLAQPLKIRKIVLNRDSESGSDTVVYELIDGERRLRAMQLVGIEKTQAWVEDLTDEEAIAQQWAANEDRADLTDYERAKKLKQLLDVLKVSQAELTSRVGKSEGWLSNHLRVLKLEPEFPTEILNQMTERQARAILSAESDDENDNTLFEVCARIKEYYEEEGDLPPANAIEDLVKTLKPDIEEESEEEEQTKAVKEEPPFKEKLPPVREKEPWELELEKSMGQPQPELKAPSTDQYKTAYELKLQNEKAYVIIIGSAEPYGYTLEMRRNIGEPLEVKGTYPNRSTLFDRVAKMIGKWNEGTGVPAEAFQKVSRENTWFESADPRIGLSEIYTVDVPKKKEDSGKCVFESEPDKVPAAGLYFSCYHRDRCPPDLAEKCREISQEKRDKTRQEGENDQWYKSRASFEELTEGFGAIVNEMLTTGRIAKIFEVRLRGELPDGTPLFVDLDDNQMRHFVVSKTNFYDGEYSLSFEDGGWKRGEEKTRIYAKRNRRPAVNELIEKIMAKCAKVKDLGIPALMTNDEKREILQETGVDNGVEEPNEIEKDTSSIEAKKEASDEKLSLEKEEKAKDAEVAEIAKYEEGRKRIERCLKCAKFQNCDAQPASEDCVFTPISEEPAPENQTEDCVECPHCHAKVPRTDHCLSCGKSIALIENYEAKPEEQHQEKTEEPKPEKPVKTKKGKASKKKATKKPKN